MVDFKVDKISSSFESDRDSVRTLLQAMEHFEQSADDQQVPQPRQGGGSDR
jgi:hypothetical protein